MPPLSTAQPQAAVAVILRPGQADLELLFIQRSTRQGDPWSGHLAFPGGRREPQDPSPQAPAERETGEEVGLSLKNATFLGALSPLTGVTLPVSVSAFVYFLPQSPPLTHSPEVAVSFWSPLTHLTDPTKQTTFTHIHEGQKKEFDAINLLGTPEPVLWGITYRFTRQLIAPLEAHNA